MATVTGLTAARMLDIEATSIVDGSVDVAGNLTLITHSGVEIDAGNIKGPSGADGASQSITEKTSTDLPSTYPVGISQFTYTTQGSWPTSLGTVFTFIVSIARGFQIISEKSTGRIWFRNVGQDSWSAFYQIASASYVDAAVAAVVDQFDVEPTPNTIAQRDANGRLQSADGPFWGTDVVNLNHLNAKMQGSELPDGVNLNDITTPGIYFQSSSSEAVSGTNYPFPYAGMLEVFNVPNFALGMYWQRYTGYGSYADAIFQRAYYNGTWYPWEVVSQDSGWVTLPIENTTNFDVFTAGIPTKIRRYGNTVNLRGVVKVLNTGIIETTSQYTTNTMHVIPSHFLTADMDYYSVWVCQGSGLNRWQLRIMGSTGGVHAGRYGPSASAIGAWLPFNVTWMLD